MSILKKVRKFISEPHMPWFIVLRVKKISPSLAKLLQYGRLNINTKKFWDEIYSSGKYQSTEVERHIDLVNQVIRFIKPNSTVLDVGCGSGLLIKTLIDQKNCRCTGVDISEVSINIIIEIGAQGYVTNLPSLPNELKDRTFNYITILETLEHLERPEQTLNAIRRLLKPDGLLISTVPDDCMSPHDIDEHLHLFDKETLSALIGIDYDVKQCLSTKSGFHTYLICTAEPRKQTQ